MDPQICNGVVAPVTSTDQAAAQYAHGSELSRPCASEGIAHTAAPGEPRREARGLVHAEVVFNLLHDGVDEGHVLAVGVGPAGVQTVGGYKDRAPLRAGLEAVPWLDTVAVHDIVHVPAAPVKAEDEVMWLAWIVAIGDLENVLATIYLVDTIGEGRLFTAAWRIGTMDRGEGAESQKSREEDGAKHCH